MKALILNSGMGSRMGDLTSEHPKCMTELAEGETIVSRQLRMLVDAGITEVVMTTGLFHNVLEEYCRRLALPLHITFTNNPLYAETNYIYSIYCAKEFLQEEILLLHGDLVFEQEVLKRVVDCENSCMVVSSSVPLPEKDFKAVVKEECIEKIGIEFFDHAVAAQPLYKLKKEDWKEWLKSIVLFCEAGYCKYYAENAFNVISGKCKIYPLDVKQMLCAEIDTPEDLKEVRGKCVS